MAVFIAEPGGIVPREMDPNTSEPSLLAPSDPALAEPTDPEPHRMLARVSTRHRGC